MTPADYVKDTETISDRHRITLYKIYARLKLHFETYGEVSKTGARAEEPRVTLKNFCESHAVSVLPIECVRRVNRAGHGRALRATCRMLFRARRDKRHLVWIYGPGSSGKTEYILKLHDIFAGDSVVFQGNYLPIQSTTRPDLFKQVVVSHEFNFKNAFKDDCLDITKQLFEGRGGLVRTGLYRQFQSDYRGCIFVVGSNSLPACEAAGQDQAFKADTWGPICTRTDFCCFTTRHSDHPQFPYTTS